jgi:hypothetical protein
MGLVPAAKGDESWVHLKANHGVRCAKRFRVRVAAAAAFLSIHGNRSFPSRSRKSEPGVCCRSGALAVWGASGKRWRLPHALQGGLRRTVKRLTRTLTLNGCLLATLRRRV